MGDKIVKQELHYSGPMPPSGELREYENIVEGSAERFLRMLEKEQEQRLEASRALIEQSKDFAKMTSRGQIFVFICVVLSLAATCVCAIFHESAAAVAAAGVTAALSFMMFRN